MQCTKPSMELAWKYGRLSSIPFHSGILVVSSHAKLTHVPLPFPRTFSLNTTFCHSIAASSKVYWLSCVAFNHRIRVQFALGSRLRGMEEYGV